MPTERPIVAEGPGFFPEAILPLLADPRRAIWLAPTETFKRASHERRGKTAFRCRTGDPDRAYRNHVESRRVSRRSCAPMTAAPPVDSAPAAP